MPSSATPNDLQDIAVPELKTVQVPDAAESNVACIVKLLAQKEAAGAKTIAVREALHREYNDWIALEREKFSWGNADCNSYYRTPSGHTPFLFPGDFKTFKRHREEAGLHEFDLS